MAGAGKEGGGAANKRVEVLEGAMGLVQEKLDEQALQFQHQADVNAGIEKKLDGLVLAQEELNRTLNQFLRGKAAEGPRTGEDSGSGSGQGSGVARSGSNLSTPPLIVSGPRQYHGRGAEGNPPRINPGGAGPGFTPNIHGLSFGSFEGGGRGRYDYRQRKIDMPTFDGTDPDGWILQAERYFAIYGLINEEKVEAVVLSLSGDALAWFRWSDKQKSLTTWDEVKSLFLQKFRSIRGGNLYEQWASLEQTGTTDDYIRRFIELAAPLEGVSEPVALANFLKGLKPIIKNEIRMWASESLGRAMDLAQQIEEKNRHLKTSGFGIWGTRANNHTYTRPTGASSYTPTNSTPGNSFQNFRRNSGNDRSLTEAQIADKRSKGLC